MSEYSDLIKVSTWVTDKLLPMYGKEHSRAIECRGRVADYFNEVASCLEELSSCFRSDQNSIPRIQGKKLEALISGFEFVLATNLTGRDKLEKNEKSKYFNLLSKSIRNAEKLDCPISDFSDLRKAAGSNEDLIAHIERVSGLFYGLSIITKTTGPFGPSG